MTDPSWRRKSHSSLNASKEHDDGLHSRLTGWLLLSLLAITLLLGGGSRADTLSLVVLRPIGAIALVFAVFEFKRLKPDTYRFPATILAAYVGYIALQLVPLPPGIWRNLPGREPLVEALNAAGISGVWHPISVLPIATFNSLAAMFVPIAGFLLFACAPRESRQRALALIGSFVLVSALIGLLQIIAGGSSWLYPYKYTNPGSPVGLFANRNHMAVVSAAAIPLLFALAETFGRDSARKSMRWIARMLGLALVFFAVMSGSRTGTALALASLAASLVLFTSREAFTRLKTAAKWQKAAFLSCLISLPTTLLFVLAEGTAFQRFAAKDNFDDLRFKILPDVLAMARDGLPIGWGYGTFPEVYEFYERIENIVPSYINRAHNDWIEVVIEGGLIGAGLIAALGFWIFKQCWANRQTLLRPSRPSEYYRTAATLGIGVLMVASLTDYPLRTPTAAIILAILLGCIGSHKLSTNSSPN